MLTPYLQNKIKTSLVNCFYSKEDLSVLRKHHFRQKKGFIYIIESKNTDMVKIGITKDLNQRMKTLKTSYPYKTSENAECNFLICCEIRIARTFEKFLHKKYKAKRLTNTEWFVLTNEEKKDLVNTIKKIRAKIYRNKKPVLSKVFDFDEEMDDILHEQHLIENYYNDYLLMITKK